MQVYLHGIPRSGTNYLEFLLKSNYVCDIIKGCKHGPIIDTGDRVIFITKHPVDWCLSYYLYGRALYEANRVWEDYLVSPITIRTAPAGMLFPHPIAFWNAMNNHYVNMATHIKLEGLCENALNHIGLTRRAQEWIGTDKHMSTGGEPTAEVFRERAHRNHYTTEQINWVMSQVDENLMIQLGYKS